MTIRQAAEHWLRERIGAIDGKLFASRLYPPDESWTRDYAWWIRIPLAAVQDDQPLHFVLEQRDGSFQHLKVPSSFIRDHMQDLKVVNGTHIHLFLSAASDWLCDRRGTGRISFRNLADNAAPLPMPPGLGSQSTTEPSRIAGLSSRELLTLYGELMTTLRARGVVRSSNNPVADYAELLAARALGLTLEPRSTTGFDGTDAEGRRHEVKARRRTPHNPSAQLSQIRGLAAGHFDYLVGIIFKPDFSIDYAASIPHAVVVERARFREHVNASIFHFTPDVLEDARVRDITAVITEASRSIDAHTVSDGQRL